MNAEQKQSHYDAGAAAKLSLGAGIAAGLVVYMVNGQDFVRAAIAASIWVAIGWYSGKAIFPRKTIPVLGSNE